MKHNMPDKEPDMKEDIEAAKERGEAVSLMEPLLISDRSRDRAALTDLAFELAQKSAGFRRSLPESLLASLADPHKRPANGTGNSKSGADRPMAATKLA